MTLYELGIPYTAVGCKVLELKSKNAILEALRLYGGGYLEKALQYQWTPYQLRQHNAALNDLQRRGIISDETDSRGMPILNVIPDVDRINIPTHVEYGLLSLAEIKVLIASYKNARYKQSPFFTYTATQMEIATAARLNRKAVIRALPTLVAKRFLKTRTEREAGVRWVTGTTVTLLCPESGVSLNDLAWHYIDRRNSIPAPAIYKMALEGYDPAYQLEGTIGHYSNMLTLCPFCTKKAFRFTATEDEDRWRCFECGLQGDSARLYTLMMWQFGKSEPFRITTAKIADILKKDVKDVGGQNNGTVAD